MKERLDINWLKYIILRKLIVKRGKHSLEHSEVSKEHLFDVCIELENKDIKGLEKIQEREDVLMSAEIKEGVVNGRPSDSPNAVDIKKIRKFNCSAVCGGDKVEFILRVDDVDGLKEKVLGEAKKIFGNRTLASVQSITMIEE